MKVISALIKSPKVSREFFFDPEGEEKVSFLVPSFSTLFLSPRRLRRKSSGKTNLNQEKENALSP